MKKLFVFFVFAAIAAVSFGQVAFTEVAFDSLDVASQKLFSQYGVVNPYGETIKVESDSIVAIFKITGIKKSRKMVADTAGVKTPEAPDQFMTIYIKGGKTMAFVSLDDPTINGNDAATISALMGGTGLKQGDDEFDTPKKVSTQEPYLIHPDW